MKHKFCDFANKIQKICENFCYFDNKFINTTIDKLNTNQYEEKNMLRNLLVIIFVLLFVYNPINPIY